MSQVTNDNTPAAPLPIVTLPSSTCATAAGHVPTLQALLVANNDLTEARAGLAVALYEEQKAATALDLARLTCEVAAIAEAGGEKGLGSNEAAQKRALAARLEDCAAYTAARTAHQEAMLDRRLAETDVTLAEGQFQALLAALQVKIFQVPADWLLLPGEAHVGRLKQDAPSVELVAPAPAVVASSNGNGNGNGVAAHSV